MPPDGGRYPNKIYLALRYQRLSFARICFSPRPQLPFLKNKVEESVLSLCWRPHYRSVALGSVHWLRSFEWPNMLPRNYPAFKFALGDSELDPCPCCLWNLSMNSKHLVSTSAPGETEINFGDHMRRFQEAWTWIRGCIIWFLLSISTSPCLHWQMSRDILGPFWALYTAILIVRWLIDGSYAPLPSKYWLPYWYSNRREATEIEGTFRVCDWK